MNADIFANFICLHFNYCIDIGEFPQVTVHMKKVKRDKTNYRPVSILRTFLKFTNNSFTINSMIFLRRYFSQVSEDFAKDYLLALLELLKKSVDNGNKFGALLTDLSKAFDCIDHKLLIAKLFWYGVSPSALNSLVLNKQNSKYQFG